MKKICNIAVKRAADGNKHLDLHFHGVVDGGWLQEDGDNASVADTIQKLSEHRDAATVHAHINSIGGSAFAGVALYNALKSHPGEVTCIVQGLAASAASLIAMSGKCLMGPGTMLMIHKPSMGGGGNADELRQAANVLDKIQDALAEIYVAKTGKTLDEVNALLDAETWMTAEDAISAGFADGMVGAEAEQEPDPSDPNEGNEPPEDLGEAIRFHGVEFPRATLPQQILAQATPRAVATPPAPPVLALVPPPAPPEPLTRAELALRSPDLVKALLEEGAAAGAATERGRLQAIDALPALGCAELVAAAKYGDKPLQAAELAVQILHAQRGAGAEMLALRQAESAALSNLGATAPDQTTATSTNRLVQAIVQGGNARRGETR